MSVTQKPLPGEDSKHFLAISYPLDWEKTLYLVCLVGLVDLGQLNNQMNQTNQI